MLQTNLRLEKQQEMYAGTFLEIRRKKYERDIKEPHGQKKNDAGGARWNFLHPEIWLSISIWPLDHQWNNPPIITAFFPPSYFLAESHNFFFASVCVYFQSEKLKKGFFWDVKLSVTSTPPKKKKKKAEGQIQKIKLLFLQSL